MQLLQERKPDLEEASAQQDSSTQSLDLCAPNMTVRSCFVTLVLLFLWRVEDLAQACLCAPVHPQHAFCHSDVVIRAKVMGAQDVDVGNDIYGNAIKWIKYDIKQTKMFKGPSEVYDAIYTPPISALCGVTLETGKEYLITGKLEADGKLHVILCDYVKPWENVSLTMKKSLPQRYEMGCDCKITRCTTLPCMISSPTECLWTDWLTEKAVDGKQAKHYACIKRSDDSCAWYRGAALPKKDFLDIEDP
ncbi:metalloproteinase inhibitor 2b [Synchiropus picturatus]